MYRKHLLLVLTVAGMQTATAQSALPFSLWAFPGGSWRPNDHLRFTAQYGYNPQWAMHAAYVQAFVRLSKHITFNPAYLYLRRQAPTLEEHTFMPALIVTIPAGILTLEDRTMYWYRIRRHAGDLHFYRNRLRLSYAFTYRKLTVRPYVYGEVFYLLNRGRWTRNRIAPGVSLDLLHRFSLDISFNRELDRYNGRSNLLFIMCTVELKGSSVAKR